MALIQYIKRKKKKEVLSMQDLNIIKQRVDGIYNNRIEVLDLDALEKCQKTLNLMPYEIKKVGVMVALLPLESKPPGVILIGYSLCHSNDRFDHEKIQVDADWSFFDLQKGRGKSIAFARAHKWAKAEGTKIDDYAKAIPESIKNDLYKFIMRSVKYFRGFHTPDWARIFMNEYHDQRRD